MVLMSPAEFLPKVSFCYIYNGQKHIRLLGSTVKLARQCRKFLANEKKDHDLRKWAIEGLSYLSLDADVKEELCDDQIALAALFDLCKVTIVDS